ncbi:MAG: ABC transporter substrate-binding protein [Thermodesulfobacteriota bacterium]
MNRLASAMVLRYAGLILIFFISGCGSPVPLKVGTTVMIDSLPLSLARHKPIFAENELTVETVYFDSSRRMREAFVDGRVQAIMTDLAGALLINDGKERGKIVRVSLKPSPSRPMFAMMTPSHQPVATRGRLENGRIAVFREAMDRYVADRLLRAAGIRKWIEIEVNSPDSGLELMQKGEVAAALLQEPLISIALRKGAHIALDDRNLMLGQTVIVFSQRMVDEKPAFIRRFLRAYEQSVRELNVRPQLYRSLVVELVRAPLEVSASMPVPIFPFPGEVPTESDIESAGHWLSGKNIISQPIPYTRLVNAGFLWDPFQFRPAACCGW